MCSNDGTKEKAKMDVARILVRTKCSMVLDETLNIKINEDVLRLKVVEDLHAPLRINMLSGGISTLASSKSDMEVTPMVGMRKKKKITHILKIEIYMRLYTLGSNLQS